MALRLDRRPAWPGEAWLTCLLLAVTVLGYAGGFGMGFVYDDHRVITGDLRAQAWPAWWADTPTGIRPLLKLSFLLNWRSGLGAPGYFAFNLLLHLANTVLLWRIGLRLLPRLAPQHAGLAAPAAWLAALLFALHPAHVEAVTYFSGRSISLMSFFLLSALLLWLRRPGHAASDTAALAAFVLALAARETALVLPVLMALVLWLSPAPTPRAWRVPIAATVIVGLAGIAVVTGHPGYQAFFAGAFGHGDPLGNLPDAARGLHYLVLRWSGLQPGSMDPVLPPDAPLWLPLTIVAALGGLLTDPGRRRRLGWLAFGMAWFLLLLAPMYSLVPRAEPANDRHLYLASWGLLLPLALMLCLLGAKQGWRRRLAIPAAIVLLVSSAMGLNARNQVLVDEEAIWREVVHQAPGHARGWHNLGVALHRQGQLVAAQGMYCRALGLKENPHSHRALRALAGQGLSDCDSSGEAAPGPLF